MNTAKHRIAVERDMGIYLEIDGAFVALDSKSDPPKLSINNFDLQENLCESPNANTAPNEPAAPSKRVKAVSRVREGDSENWPIRNLFNDFINLADK